MLEGGEDPRFIARRMVILASEDIGNADPQALAVAVAAAQAVEHVGLPEGQFALAQAAIYLSLAPKSDAAKRAHRRGARATSASTARKPPPACAAQRRLPGAARARARHGLRLPARPPGPPVNDQELLPEGLEGLRFYAPDEAEAEPRERLEEIREARGRDRPPRPVTCVTQAASRGCRWRS